MRRRDFLCAAPPLLAAGCAGIGRGRRPPIAFILHGGAGSLVRGRIAPEAERGYREKLSEARDSGYAVLEKGGTALDAVERAIVILEDSPLFNAGKGAVFTAQGTNELDASIMDGATRNAGAVAAVRRLKNPIRVARKVMEKSPHVMLSGEGAEIFAREQGFEWVAPGYFKTEHSWRALQRRIEAEKKRAADKHGTVGAAARDRLGNLVAGTSTGGLTYKQFGRIGDSPIIGAGTWADNRTCAVSCTGHGEFFIRLGVAHRIAAMMEHGGATLEQAADRVVKRDLVEMGGAGGVIAVDAAGNVAAPFNTRSMLRAWRQEGMPPVVHLYGEG